MLQNKKRVYLQTIAAVFSISIQHHWFPFQDAILLKLYNSGLCPYRASCTRSPTYQRNKIIMADMMTRWYKGYRGRWGQVSRVTEALATPDILPSLEDPDFERLTDKMIKDLKKQHRRSRLANTHLEPSSIYKLDGTIEVPDTESALPIKVLLVAHCCNAGHRKSDATASFVKEQFGSKHIEKDRLESVNACLHCLLSKTAHKIPRPLSMTVHAKTPNELVQFDYFYMGPWLDNLQFVLVMQDDLSSYSIDGWVYVIPGGQVPARHCHFPNLAPFEAVLKPDDGGSVMHRDRWLRIQNSSRTVHVPRILPPQASISISLLESWCTNTLRCTNIFRVIKYIPWHLYLFISTSISAALLKDSVPQNKLRRVRQPGDNKSNDTPRGALPRLTLTPSTLINTPQCMHSGSLVYECSHNGSMDSTLHGNECFGFGPGIEL